jgi:2,3-bisphosphoglycerate-independent phosphoglycerate mutase
MPPKPVCLIIRDGWGKGPQVEGNAIWAAQTPHADRYESTCPTILVHTSGLDVGLPAGTQGNSEVGHLNLGAGRVVYQSLTRIDKAIEDGDFYQNEVLAKAINHAVLRDSTVHLMGLVQDEGVHAMSRHAVAIADMCARAGHTRVLVHAISDGRDTPPKSAMTHFDWLDKELRRVGVGRIASVVGRYYAMDRDQRWERTELAYRMLMHGEGEPVRNWQEAIEAAYRAGENDEFIRPRVIDFSGLADDDVFIFFNFRFDRTRQLTRAIAESSFDAFPTRLHSIHFVAMTHYYDEGNFSEVFPEIQYENILGEVVAKAGLTQLRCSETEKFAHVTFFFNALRNEPFPGEDRILVDSPKVATYDLKPEMSALEVTEKLLSALEKGGYDLIVCNFANGDMVGHTGVYEAIVKAVETVDRCVGQVVDAVVSRGGVVLLTADHGNAEQTRLEDGSPMTAHTQNPVPLSMIGGPPGLGLREGGRLSDIAPTILDLLNLPAPSQMSGRSLLV